MKYLLLLIKNQLKNKYRGSLEGKGRYGMYALYAILGVYAAGLIIYFCVQIAFLAPHMTAAGEAPLLFLLPAAAAISFTLVLGTISTVSSIYTGSDTEFLLSLPVTSNTVFWSRFLVVYIEEAIISAAILLPTLLTAGIATGLAATTPLFYVFLLLALVLVPAFPLVLVAVLAIPVMYLLRLLRNRGVLTFIAYTLLMTLLIGGIIGVSLAVQTGFSDTVIPFGDVSDIIINNYYPLKYALYPVYALCSFGAAASAVPGVTGIGGAFLSLGIAVSSVAVLSFLSSLLARAVYRRNISALLENRKTKGKAGGTYESGGVLKAFMLKEIREIIRQPNVGFQCLGGVIMVPLMIFIMNFSLSRAAMEDAEATLIMDVVSKITIMYFVIFMGAGMNAGATSCISREGTNFYFTKILPVDYAVQVRAKSYVYTIIMALAVTVGTIAFFFITYDAISAVYMFVISLVFGYGTVCFYMRFDIAKPRLVWSNPMDVMKRSVNTTVPILIITFSGMFFMVPIGVAVFFLSGIWLALVYTIILAFMVGYAALTHIWMYRTAAKSLPLVE